jgi:hypothetical protein
MTISATAPTLAGADADSRWSAGPRAAAPAAPAEFIASLALHAALVAAVVLLAISSPLPPLTENAVETEVISAGDFDARYRPPPSAPSSPSAAVPSGEAAAPAAAQPPPVRPEPAAPAAPPDMVRPSQMLSEQALGRPGSRGLRRELGRLVEEDRVAQLCNLEAMEQIHAWRRDFQPDRLVDYARSDTRMQDHTLIAQGGAFRSARNWYEVSYRCELDAGLSKVVGFAFRVGAAIPREEWMADNLPALH